MAGLANQKQEGGTHYSAHGQKDLQHWDVVRIFDLGYLIGNATKYLFRWRNKNGVEDLKKAIHYIEKQIEEIEPKSEVTDLRLLLPELHVPQPSVLDYVYWNDTKFVNLARITDDELMLELNRRSKEREAAAMSAYARRKPEAHVMTITELEYPDAPLAGPPTAEPNAPGSASPAGPVMCHRCGKVGGHVPECPSLRLE